MSQRALISALVVHWGDVAPLRRLLASWPDDPRFELVVVLNQAVDAAQERIAWPERTVVVEPGGNLGFAAGVNAALRQATAPAVLLLNPDARPLGDALDQLATALPNYPDAAGLVPSLVSPDGSTQHRWQLQPLPTTFDLLLQVFFLAGRRGPTEPPASGTEIEQPAAAALLLRRSILEQLGGLDAGFFPAWFEDVDLARRLRDRGERLIYLREARFEHEMGSSVSSLGYGLFLWIYLRHLARYLRKHHGLFWSRLARILVPVSCCLRILALPVRSPRRARNRFDAATGLVRVAIGAVSGWRWPVSWARRFRDASTR
ncbi:MAG: glycosyltransferase family 2 protein [Thermoanaerobaculia bacterium]|nr:glycosyltransferase family 2 protein [Thermoanaerobaculia bacterium]